MKIHFRTSGWLFAALAAIAVCLSSRLPATPADAVNFPYTIPVDLGSVEFAPGDTIVINMLRGDRAHLEVGGRYLLEGSYTLTSVESAKLGWSITTRGPSGPTPVSAEENTVVSRGSGTFRLIKTFLSDGWPHVSFYADRHSHGGVYFGEVGIEQTVLRNKGWSDFAERKAGPLVMTVGRGMEPLAPVNPGTASPASLDPTSSPNREIMAYLGNPVPPPANVDPGYTAAGLTGTFEAVCKGLGLKVVKLAVDESEFPFLVYGVMAGRNDFREIQTALGTLPGYTYGGSVTGGGAQGGYFAVNLTPGDRYPRGQAEAIRRRVMIRLQMLAARVQK